MYCIECGAQIPNKSAYCSECGYKQNLGKPAIKEKIPDIPFEKEIKKLLSKSFWTSTKEKVSRNIIGWYLAWILLHLAFLLIFSDGIFDGNNSKDGLDDFWPFNFKSRLSYYDITEFLIYTIFPIAILAIIRLTRKSNSNITNNSSGIE